MQSKDRNSPKSNLRFLPKPKLPVLPEPAAEESKQQKPLRGPEVETRFRQAIEDEIHFLVTLLGDLATGHITKIRLSPSKDGIDLHDDDGNVVGHKDIVYDFDWGWKPVPRKKAQPPQK